MTKRYKIKMVNNKKIKKTTMKELIQKAEHDYIVWILNIVNWRIDDAAELLKISRRTLSRKIQKYGIKK